MRVYAPHEALDQPNPSPLCGVRPPGNHEASGMPGRMHWDANSRYESRRHGGCAAFHRQDVNPMPRNRMRVIREHESHRHAGRPLVGRPRAHHATSDPPGLWYGWFGLLHPACVESAY